MLCRTGLEAFLLCFSRVLPGSQELLKSGFQFSTQNHSHSRFQLNFLFKHKTADAWGLALIKDGNLFTLNHERSKIVQDPTRLAFKELQSQNTYVRNVTNNQHGNSKNLISEEHVYYCSALYGLSFSICNSQHWTFEAFPDCIDHSSSTFLHLECSKLHQYPKGVSRECD